MDFKHLPLTSAGGTQLVLEVLYRIVPSCFTETFTPPGGGKRTLRHVVDFKKLRQLLGDETVEDGPEAYEFTWVGKQAARREAATPINKTLRPIPESSVDWENTQNIYIEGDNLDALKLLQKSYLGKVKMIYIDPPYNTGNDFVYRDSYKQSQSEYDEQAGNVDELGNRFVKNTDSNGRFHSDWCSMIYPRLQLAHSLLTEDGVIFISIDDNEVENLRKICDEIFGEENFLATFIWEKRTSRENRKVFSVNQDYIIAYSKHRSAFETDRGSLPYTEEIKKRYSNPDNDPRGAWQSVALTVQGGHGTKRQFYKITTPSGRIVDVPSGLCWRYTESKLNELINDNRIYFGADGNNVPRLKVFLSEMNQGITPHTLWKADEVGTNDSGKRELLNLFEGKSAFDTPKPVSLIKRLLEITSNSKDFLALDFFSGSATTAHAVMQQNAEDGGNRKFIMVQLPEETDKDSEAYKAGYNNICELGEERIRRAGKKIREELQGRPLQTDGHEDRTLPDTGFRVFRIDSSNMKDVYFAPKDFAPQQLDLFEDNVKEGRTELDLLYGCMVDWGVQLSLPLQTETIDGLKVYTINEGDLVACFGKPITDKVVKAIADKAPLRVLFRDSCFEKDEQKINIFEQFKQLLGWSDDEALNNIRVI